jgi:hypothetical protein
MSVTSAQPAGATAVRPFHVDIPDEALEELRRRIAATRWYHAVLAHEQRDVQGACTGSTAGQARRARAQ